VVLRRRAWAVAHGAIQDDGVDLGPKQLKHFAERVLLAEPTPPKALEAILGWEDGNLLDIADLDRPQRALTGPDCCAERVI